MSQNPSVKQALDTLSSRDEDIKRAFAAYGYPKDRFLSQSYETLAKIIIGQQISRSAASSIWERLASAGWVTSEMVAQLQTSDLQDKGVSLRKAEYLIGVADAIVTGALVLEAFRAMPGDEVHKQLVALRGVGNWTAYNYRLFALGDLDAWAANDLALQEGMKRLKRLNHRPDEAQMEQLARPWAPYRGVGALFLWHLYAIEVRNATPSAL